MDTIDLAKKNNNKIAYNNVYLGLRARQHLSLAPVMK